MNAKKNNSDESGGNLTDMAKNPATGEAHPSLLHASGLLSTFMKYCLIPTQQVMQLDRMWEANTITSRFEAKLNIFLIGKCEKIQLCCPCVVGFQPS